MQVASKEGSKSEPLKIINRTILSCICSTGKSLENKSWGNYIFVLQGKNIVNPKIKKGRTTLEVYQEVLMFPKNGKARVSPLSQHRQNTDCTYILPISPLMCQVLGGNDANKVGNADGLNKYRKLVDIFRFSGGHDEAETYLIYWGIPSFLHNFLLASAEYDAQRSGGVR